MKKLSAKEKEKECDEILAASERTRQACNKLTSEERQELLDAGLRIIYGSDAKKTIRSH
ncbi:MAG: hypothetical protein M3Y82_01425 [Verrucomicrobiota bacterium]|nr:hypothetical protein [Verrucomicrobiota bacterium]